MDPLPSFDALAGFGGAPRSRSFPGPRGADRQPPGNFGGPPPPGWVRRQRSEGFGYRGSPDLPPPPPGGDAGRHAGPPPPLRCSGGSSSNHGAPEAGELLSPGRAASGGWDGDGGASVGKHERSSHSRRSGWDSDRSLLRSVSAPYASSQPGAGSQPNSPRAQPSGGGARVLRGGDDIRQQLPPPPPRRASPGAAAATTADASRLPTLPEHSPVKSLESGQLLDSGVAAGAPLGEPPSAATPNSKALPPPLKTEPDAGGEADLPPGFVSPDHHSDADLASPPSASQQGDGQEAQGDAAHDGGATAPKRRRLGWGQGLARLRSSPDGVQRKKQQQEAPAGEPEAPDAGPDQADGTALAVEPPQDVPMPDADAPSANGMAVAAANAEPQSAAEPASPQPPLPSKLELMTTMEQVRGCRDV